MKRQQLDEIRARLAKANAPWVARYENCGGGKNVYTLNDPSARVCHTAEQRDRTGTIVTSEQAIANAEFIAQAPSDIAALIDYLDSLGGEHNV